MSRRGLVYVKIFGTILDSSIWDTPTTTRIVWITMLAMADVEGFVKASVGGIAARARVSRDDCRAALDTLESPEPESGTQEYEGRRIQPVEGGWVVLNYEKYREIRTAQQLRDAARQRLHRARVRTDAVESHDDRDGNRDGRDKSQQAEAVSVSKATKAKPASPSRGRATWLSPFSRLWHEHYGAAITYGQAAKVLRPLVTAHGEADVLRALGNYLALHDGERAAYVSLPKFGSTFKQWLKPAMSRGASRQAANEAAIDEGTARVQRRMEGRDGES